MVVGVSRLAATGREDRPGVVRHRPVEDDPLPAFLPSTHGRPNNFLRSANFMEISLFGLSGGAELGGIVMATWMVISMLVIAALAVAALVFRSPVVRFVQYVFLLLACLMFQPWLYFVPSAANDEDSDVAALDDMFFVLGICWVVTFVFVIACHGISRRFFPPPDVLT